VGKGEYQTSMHLSSTLLPFTGSENRMLFIKGDGMETTLKPLLLQNS
jgi:hypothetical protein